MGLFYNIGKLVKEKREKKGLSQRKLAELADVSHTEISRIESGERKRPAPYILKRVAPHLGVKYEELLEAAGYEELVVEKPFSPKPDLIIKEHSAQYISAVKDFIDETLLDDLTPEEREKLETFKKFLISQRQGKKE